MSEVSNYPHKPTRISHKNTSALLLFHMSKNIYINAHINPDEAASKYFILYY